MKSSLDSYLNNVGAQDGTTVPLSLAAMLSQANIPASAAGMLSPAMNGNSSAGMMNPQDMQTLMMQIQQGQQADSTPEPTGDSTPTNTVDSGNNSSPDDVTLQNDLPASRIGSSDPDSMDPANQAMLQSVLNGSNAPSGPAPDSLPTAIGSVPPPDMGAMPPQDAGAPQAPIAAPGMAGSTGTPSSLSSALNNMASGAGNTDYDAIQAGYPQSQTQAPQSLDELQQQYTAAHMNQSPILNQVQGAAYAQEAQRQQQAQVMAQQNHDNVAAYEGAFRAATESGKNQHEAAALAEQVVKDKNEADYQRGQIANKVALQPSEIAKNSAEANWQNARSDRNQWKVVPNVISKNGNTIEQNQTTGEQREGIAAVSTKPTLAQTVKPLAAAQQNLIDKKLNDVLSSTDPDTGKKSVIPLDPMQKLAISQEAANRLKSGAASSAPDAVGSVMSDLTGGKDLNDVLQPQTKPGMLWGTNPTGKLQFPNLGAVIGGANKAPATLSAAASQSAANPNSAAPSIATVKSDADFNALPSGSLFVGPDGKTRKKP